LPFFNLEGAGHFTVGVELPNPNDGKDYILSVPET